MMGGGTLSSAAACWLRRVSVFGCLFAFLQLLNSALAGRESQALGGEWKFIKREAAPDESFESWENVTVPHTWNAIDGQNGMSADPQYPAGYYRGPAWYARRLTIPASWQEKRVFVCFEAASLVADSFINGVHLGQHRGGSSKHLLAAENGDLWDSRKVLSSETILRTYGGESLLSGRTYWWKVASWDKDNKQSMWSEPVSWTMGLLENNDWKDKWIAGPPPDHTADAASPTLLLRRDFQVKPNLQQALVYVCGLGEYQMLLNGAKVSEDVFTPGWTVYSKTCLYDTYDVTNRIRTGANGVGLILGNGMYNVAGDRYTKFKGSFGPRQALAQIKLTYSDGTQQIVCTDEYWFSAPGPITFSCVYGGEGYDARREPTGWSESGFRQGDAWVPARVGAGPGGALKGSSAAAPPIRLFETLRTVGAKELGRSVTIYDLGQNAALIPRLTVEGPVGSTVKIVPSELARESGPRSVADWVKIHRPTSPFAGHLPQCS